MNKTTAKKILKKVNNVGLPGYKVVSACCLLYPVSTRHIIKESGILQ